ncbi:hypothetical protein D1BOALGB6SA_7657 [Olavius sp. associated proteobacterium Delta 1]|nr:hypothetical protein D1BOALGB6SA_7657 [Olavius sp. associated proteobacterium Delta 1]
MHSDAYENNTEQRWQNSLYINRLMDELKLFTDGSVDTLSKIGYGAYLIVSEHRLSLNTLGARVKVRRFENTSSTKLELQTLVWALSDIQELGSRVIVYTDSQNIMGLVGLIKLTG